MFEKVRLNIRKGRGYVGDVRFNGVLSMGGLGLDENFQIIRHSTSLMSTMEMSSLLGQVLLD